ncbi:glycerophosphoryl diester phosphodiesterase [Fontimonas thermophila]|uniref:Glycerophosphoryl diester phosphodiesterase n=1 Tax=Fontimonas thermophila TaxID=1076937 RepID=A0A1I2JWU1_9GAMM|nr:glycerophosphodiester phosphodiesterase family protein [Fontimonas thermophila]SFF57291.1 glycerophosphoryl diester phosphodiesterase [Fontimonas thermophila]
MPANTCGFTVIGHRGACGHAPENTLLSIDTAIRLGAHYVEIDVQHHDGELWLMHDLTLDRTTNGKGLLTAHTAAALRRLDAGGGEIIPTLPEALDLIEQRVGVNIELKSWNGCAAAVAAVLRDYIADGWPAERFLVSSFHLPELWEFKQLLPEVPLGVLYCGVPLDWAGIATELGAVALNISAEFVDPRLIADAHARGLQLNVYTVNAPEELQQLRALGVDGVFTDYPERALALG